MTIVDGAAHGREDHAARDGRDEQRAAALGVAAQSSQAKGEDGGEARRLETEHKYQHRDGCRAGGGDGGDGEDEAEEEVDGEDQARPEGGYHHEAAGNEPVQGVEALAHGEEV